MDLVKLILPLRSDPLAFFAVLLAGYLLIRMEKTLGRLAGLLERMTEIERSEMAAINNLIAAMAFRGGSTPFKE